MSKKKITTTDQKCTDCGKMCDPLLLYPLPIDKWQRKMTKEELEAERLRHKEARRLGGNALRDFNKKARATRKARICPDCLKRWRKAAQQQQNKMKEQGLN